MASTGLQPKKFIILETRGTAFLMTWTVTFSRTLLYLEQTHIMAGKERLAKAPEGYKSHGVLSGLLQGALAYWSS